MSSSPKVLNPQGKPYASDTSDEEWKVIEPKSPAQHQKDLGILES